jgi:hypothetical protein
LSFISFKGLISIEKSLASSFFVAGMKIGPELSVSCIILCSLTLEAISSLEALSGFNSSIASSSEIGVKIELFDLVSFSIISL